MNIKLCPLFVLVLLCTGVFAQEMPVYNQFFFNRALYNPSFLGQSGYTEANINHRQQWIDIEGAPVTTNLNFQAPLSRKFALGVVLYNDERGLLSTYESSVGLSYTIELANATHLSFGLTAGVGRNDIEVVMADQALVNALDKSFYMASQFGVNLTIQNLTVGFALPRLVQSDFLQESHFDDLGIEASKTTFSSVGYEFTPGPRVKLEPILFYQTDEKSKNQLGAVAVLTYDDLFWIGAGYKQDIGANGFLGLTVNNFIKIGYSYDFAPEITSGLGKGSHEFQLGIRLGKKNKREFTPIKATNTKESPLEEQMEEEYKDEFIEEKEEEQTIDEGLEQIAEQEPEVIIPVEPSVEHRIVKENVESVSGMAPGYYVVVGTYRSIKNAKSYAASLRSSGYEPLLGYNQITQLNYVYIQFTEDRNTAIKNRNEISKIAQFEFQDAWILQIEK